ncbi:hypothetical protein [Nocardia brasiliensis]|uniref:hypothetical protein n=1 Tax=Nocardia brasiliensis TaxID=37326 RepID=UPI00366DF25A
MHRSRSGQSRHILPKVAARDFLLIGWVLPTGQVTVCAASSTMKSSQLIPPSTAGFSGPSGTGDLRGAIDVQRLVGVSGSAHTCARTRRGQLLADLRVCRASGSTVEITPSRRDPAGDAPPPVGAVAALGGLDVLASQSMDSRSDEQSPDDLTDYFGLTEPPNRGQRENACAPRARSVKRTTTGQVPTPATG